MNFKFFSGMGRAAFNHFKSVPTVNIPKNTFMKKMTQMETVSLVAKTGLPMTSAGLILHNLSRLLDKKEGTVKEIQSILGALIGASSEEGTKMLDRILLDWILMIVVIIAGVQLTMSNISKLAQTPITNNVNI